MFRADVPWDWRTRGERIIGEHDSAEAALAHVEGTNSLAYIALSDAVRHALHIGADIREVHKLSGWSVTRLRSIRESGRDGAEGDIEALRIAYFTTFEDVLATVAYAHLRAGVKQKEIARIIGSGQPTISSWCNQAVNVPEPLN